MYPARAYSTVVVLVLVLSSLILDFKSCLVFLIIGEDLVSLNFLNLDCDGWAGLANMVLNLSRIELGNFFSILVCFFLAMGWEMVGGGLAGG